MKITSIRNVAAAQLHKDSTPRVGGVPLLWAALLFVGILSLPLAPQAQDEGTPVISLRSGFYAGLHGGVTYGFYNDLGNDLNTLEALATDSLEFNYNGLGSQVGGHLGGLYKNFMVEISGTYTGTDNNQTFNGSARLTDLRFGFKVGYIIYNEKQFLLYPFVGAQFGTSTLELANFRTDSLRFGDYAIGLNDTREFTANPVTFELGLAAKYALRPTGDLLLGAELGGYIGSGTNWEDADGVQPAVNQATLQGIYLRVSISGGIFKNSSSPSRGRDQIRREEDDGGRQIRRNR